MTYMVYMSGSRQVTWPSLSWISQARVIFKIASSQIAPPPTGMITFPKCKSSPASCTPTLRSVSPSMIPFRSDLWNTHEADFRLRILTRTTIMGFMVWTGRPKLANNTETCSMAVVINYTKERYIVLWDKVQTHKDAPWWVVIFALGFSLFIMSLKIM